MNYIMTAKSKTQSIIKEEAESSQATNMKIATEVTSMLDDDVFLCCQNSKIF